MHQFGVASRAVTLSLVHTCWLLYIATFDASGTPTAQSSAAFPCRCSANSDMDVQLATAQPFFGHAPDNTYVYFKGNDAIVSRSGSTSRGRDLILRGGIMPGLLFLQEARSVSWFPPSMRDDRLYSQYLLRVLRNWARRCHVELFVYLHALSRRPLREGWHCSSAPGLCSLAFVCHSDNVFSRPFQMMRPSTLQD